MEGCKKVFSEWNSENDHHLTLLRDYLKGRSTGATMRRMQPEHKPLVDRLNELRKQNGQELRVKKR